MAERILLIVDDEVNIIRSLTRVLRRDGYQLLSARNGEEALTLMEKTPGIGVIISDQRMPQMTGAEFLHAVKERYPDTVRLMLSGYTDLKSVTDAINVGAIYKFLTKPWEDELLRASVREAFEKFEMRADNRRLTAELEKAYRELSMRVEDQCRVIDINHRVLEVSREMLERLPLGVLGMSNDQMIAIANSRMHEILGTQQGMLVGNFASEVLPREIQHLGAEACREFSSSVELGERRYMAYGAPLGAYSAGSGCMLVLVPQEGV